jgi:hypothetical protein
MSTVIPFDLDNQIKVWTFHLVYLQVLHCCLATYSHQKMKHHLHDRCTTVVWQHILTRKWNTIYMTSAPLLFGNTFSPENETLFIWQVHHCCLATHSHQKMKHHLYIKSCSHEVAKHKSGVIYRFHLTVPPLWQVLHCCLSTYSHQKMKHHLYDRCSTVVWQHILARKWNTIYMTGAPLLYGNTFSPENGTPFIWQVLHCCMETHSHQKMEHHLYDRCSTVVWQHIFMHQTIPEEK